RDPESIALTCNDVVLTFRALQERADRVAAVLARIGVQPGEHVGLYAGRTATSVAAILGILTAGAVYVPLDPTYPIARLEVMLNDAAPPVLLTDRVLPSALQAATAGVVMSLEEAVCAVPESAE